MKLLDPMTRPTVDQETLTILRYLTDTKIFRMQYDVWAFGLALAIRRGLSPVNLGSGREQLPQLSTLPEETRFALEQALLANIRDTVINDYYEHINKLAVAGLQLLNKQMDNLSTQERIDIIMKQAYNLRD